MIKEKDLPEWEVNIEEANVKDNGPLLSCSFGVHFTLWLSVYSTKDGMCRGNILANDYPIS